MRSVKEEQEDGRVPSEPGCEPSASASEAVFAELHPSREQWATIEAAAVHYVDDGRETVLCDRLPRPITLVLQNPVLRDGALPVASEGRATSLADRGGASAATLIFEPHSLFGTDDPDGNPLPFGYISEGIGQPIFELTDVLGRPADELARWVECLLGYANRDSDRSGEAGETGTGSTGGESAGPQDIAQTAQES